MRVHNELRKRGNPIGLPSGCPSPRSGTAVAHGIAPIHHRQDRNILGVTIRALTGEQAVCTIDDALHLGVRLSVCFANAQALNVAWSNERFRKALQRFLVLNDGLGVDIASRVKFGEPFVENLNGTDFVPSFLSKTKHRLRIYLVGTTDTAVEQAARNLRVEFPNHTIVGWRNGFFSGPQDIEETCRAIRAARTDCLLVGMGNPLQELWIDDHGGKTGAKLMFAVGALLDFQAETVNRAPMWIRELRCEWIYRLLQEPRRLARRYLVGNGIFLIRVLADAYR